MLEKSRLIDEIRFGFATLQAYVEPGGPLNLTDINVHAEDFVGSVLNALYGWDLVNRNKNTANAACTDLIGKSHRIAVQVTSERRSDKVNDTLQCLKNQNGALEIDRLIMFVLLPKQGSFTVNVTCPNLTFRWRQDVLDFGDVLKAAQGLSDLAHLGRVHQQVIQAMPKVFESSRSNVREQATQLRELLSFFDREVLSASLHYEEPVQMCRALREIRVSLQKRGARIISNNAAAKAFSEIIDVLRHCEYGVKDNFPTVFAAAFPEPHGSYDRFNAFDYNEQVGSINLMMAIRPEIERLIEVVKQELHKCDEIIA